MTDQPTSITCPRCRRTSYNPNDIAAGYCGACHDWTGPGTDTEQRVTLVLGGYPEALSVLINSAKALVQVADWVGLEAMSHTLIRVGDLPVPADVHQVALSMADQRAFLDATIAYVDKIKSLGGA
ncbi:hypothetical protein Aple_010520 [Acrocarpospora pleiomorpha]|uniref:Uncharacterized protein n=1 Tax=Acrocarpospora pleiomorpha TaxID=90975 RepID=A0A5M3X8V7_9ACTN|nr:hypothetical protein [Acrocarpospora pleiomorpha]GES18157.1 hypothetical protein Aple_010520 [Acrocarpospora pleiomorpha]